MNILIDIVEQRDVRDAVVAVGAKARIDCSPSDGFNSGLIKKLERDLGLFVEERLTEALKEGRKPRLNCERFKTAGEAAAAFERETGRSYSIFAEGVFEDYAAFVKWQYLPAPSEGGDA